MSAPAGSRQRSWLFDIFTHNFAEGLRTARTVERKAHGLNMSDLPYPGNTNNSSTVTQQSVAGWLAGPLVGATLLAGGYAASKLAATPPAAAVTPAVVASAVQPPQPTPTAKPYTWDEIEQIKQPDGTWKNTGRSVRKRMSADGTIEILSSK